MKLRPTLLLASTALAFLAGCQTPPATNSTANAPAPVLQPLTGEIFALKDVDVPPKMQRHAMPGYPFNLRRSGISGEAVIRFVVDTRGKTRDIEILSSTHEEFGAAAAATVAKWRYDPARKNGQPVNVHLRMPMIFNINSSMR